MRLLSFVAKREWVMLAVGVLMIGVSACLVPSSHLSESAVGVVLAALLLLAMGLFLWIRLERDLRDGRVAETEVTVVAKESARNEAAMTYEIVTASKQRFQVSAMDYAEIDAAGRYRILYTVAQRIVLTVHEIDN